MYVLAHDGTGDAFALAQKVHETGNLACAVAATTLSPREDDVSRIGSMSSTCHVQPVIDGNIPWKACPCLVLLRCMHFIYCLRR